MKEQLEELQRRRAASLELGGPERVARQRKENKYTARERIDLLFDRGTFNEIGQLATYIHTRVTKIKGKIAPADGVITGFGQVDGRRAGVISEDFTVMGGSLGLINFAKKNRMIDICTRDMVPLIWLFDGAGARTDEFIGQGMAPMHHFMALARMSGVTPQVCAVLGPTAGDSSLIASMMEFIVMTKGRGMLAAGGPPLVLLGTGQTVNKEELGGSDVHCRISGVADNEAQTEEEAIDMIKRYFSYMPHNAYEYPPSIPPTDDPARMDEELLHILPQNLKRPYDMQRIIDIVLDRDSFFEIKPTHAQMVITGLGRLNGHPVGIIANQPQVYAGAITAASGAKHRHFMDMCSAYHLPIIFFTDTPGVMTGPASEREGALRAGMSLAHSFAFADTPIFTVVIHKGFGYGAAAMGGGGAGHSVLLAWPTADFNAIPLESGILAAYGAEIRAAPDPEAFRKQLEDEFKVLCGAFPAAEIMSIDEVIDPRETRPRLIEALERAIKRRSKSAQPTVRHGVMP